MERGSFRDRPGGVRQLNEGRLNAEVGRSCLAREVELGADPVAGLLEFGAEFGNQVLFALVQVMAEAFIPVFQPAGDFSFELRLGLNPEFAEIAAARFLGLLSQPLDLFGTVCLVGIDLLPQSLQFLVVALLVSCEPDFEEVARQLCWHGPEQTFELLNAAFHAVHLSTHDDFADTLDLVGQIDVGAGGCMGELSPGVVRRGFPDGVSGGQRADARSFGVPL